jgi:hypothetical protein
MSKIKTHFHDQIVKGQQAAAASQYAPGEHVRFTSRSLATGAEVDTESGAIYGVNMCQVGEAKGHDIYLEQEFIDNVVALTNAAPDGLKCRFGHPGMCMESLGTFIGRFRNGRIEGNKAVADLYLDDSARISPNGNMYDYILKMTADNPDMMGPSIVFEMGQSYYRTYDGRKVIWKWSNKEDNYIYVDESGEQVSISDVDQSKSYATIVSLDACDVVDEPAATSGMFAAKSFGVQIHNFFDSFPDAWKMLNGNAALRRFFEQQMPQSKEFFRQYEAAQKAAGPTGPQGKAGPTGIQLNKPTPSQIMLSEKAKASLKKLGRLKFDISAVTTDGVDIVVVTSSDTPAVGDAVEVVGSDGTRTPAPDGQHVVNGGDLDGAIIVTVDGLITEYTPAEAAPVDPIEDAPMAAESTAQELAALRTEIKQLKAQITPKATHVAADNDPEPDGAKTSYEKAAWNQYAEKRIKGAKK